MKLTTQDRRVLRALSICSPATSRVVASEANIRTSSPSETAARHLIRLTTLGLAEKQGTRMYPCWIVTSAGRQALATSKGGER